MRTRTSYCELKKEAWFWGLRHTGIQSAYVNSLRGRHNDAKTAASQETTLKSPKPAASPTWIAGLRRMQIPSRAHHIPSHQGGDDSDGDDAMTDGERLLKLQLSQ